MIDMTGKDKSTKKYLLDSSIATSNALLTSRIPLAILLLNSSSISPPTPIPPSSVPDPSTPPSCSSAFSCVATRIADNTASVFVFQDIVLSLIKKLAENTQNLESKQMSYYNYLVIENIVNITVHGINKTFIV